MCFGNLFVSYSFHTSPFRRFLRWHWTWDPWHMCNKTEETQVSRSWLESVQYSVVFSLRLVSSIMRIQRCFKMKGQAISWRETWNASHFLVRVFILLSPKPKTHSQRQDAQPSRWHRTCQFISSKATLHLPVLNMSLSVGKAVHRRGDAKTGLYLTVTIGHIRSPVGKIGFTQFHARSIFCLFINCLFSPCLPSLIFGHPRIEKYHTCLLKMAGSYSRLVQILKYLVHLVLGTSTIASFPHPFRIPSRPVNLKLCSCGYLLHSVPGQALVFCLRTFKFFLQSSSLCHYLSHKTIAKFTSP